MSDEPTTSSNHPAPIRIWNWNEAGAWYFLAFVIWPAALVLRFLTPWQPVGPNVPSGDSDAFLRLILPIGAILACVFAFYIARSLTLWVEIGYPLRFGSLLRTQAIPWGMVQRIWIEDGSNRHPIGWLADQLQRDAVVLVIEINHYHTLTTRVHRKYFPALLEFLPLLPQFGCHPMHDEDHGGDDEADIRHELDGDATGLESDDEAVR